MLERSWGRRAAVLLALSPLVLAVAARPNLDGFVKDVRQPENRGNLRTRERKSDLEVIVRSDIAVSGDEAESRAGHLEESPWPPSTRATPLGESLKTVTKQLLQAPTATDMVATDVRTPPRVKTQVKEGYKKGEVIPVIMEELDERRPQAVTTGTPPGLSTWVLLAGADQSTAAPPRRSTATPVRTSSPSRPMFVTTEKPVKIKVSDKPKNTIKKHNSTKEDPTPTTITLLDPKFKNRTPIVVGRPPSSTPKTKVESSTTSKIAVSTLSPTTTSVGLIRRKPTVSITRVKNHGQLPDMVPTTSLLLETGTVETKENITTTEGPSTTTKKTRRTNTKKNKKKNKNRRRRPTTTEAQSKIDDNEVSETKIEATGARPLSTRIYNYLSREVMPNVGVGLVGLVLTAGLAGLLLYPFGGGIARRNYEKPVSNPDNHMYYYSDYSPSSDDSLIANDESLFTNSYSPASYDTASKFGNHKYRYEHEFMNSNVNGYAGIKDYSTLPDSVKSPENSTVKDYSTIPESAKSPEYSPLKDYSTLPEAVKISEYSTLPESTKHDYYSMEPMYKGEASSYTREEPKYPSLTEYTSYTSADTVGTGPSYDHDKEPKAPEMAEDKSDKAQPQFSALVGSPHFANSDFVGSVSVSGSYGAEMVHKSGVSMDHGPRSLKTPEKKPGKSRKRRDVHDDNDFANEIDDSEIDDKVVKHIVSGSPSAPPTSAVETTTGAHGEPSTPLPEENEVTTVVGTDQSPTAQTVVEQEVTTLRSNSGSLESEAEALTTPSTEDNAVAPQQESSFFSLLRNILQIKFRIGLNILRSTTEAFQRYLGRVSRRMEYATRNSQSRSGTSSKGWMGVSRSKRSLRSIRKSHPSKPIKKTKKH